MNRATILVATCLLAPLVQKAPRNPLFDSKATVTVLFPSTATKMEGRMTMAGAPIFGVSLRPANGGAIVPDGKSDWISTGFPVAWQMSFVKSTERKSQGILELEYRSYAKRVVTTVLKIRMPIDADESEVLPKFMIPGDRESIPVKRAIAAAYEAIAAHVFSGDLGTIPHPAQLALLELAHDTAKGVGIAPETFKDRTYLAVDVLDDAYEYNSLKLNASQRVAHVVNNGQLSVLKAFAKPMDGVTTVFGIKVHALIHYADFVSREHVGVNDLTIYAPAELIKKFADADITNQEFIDGCTVILDGNRVKVDLSLGG